MYKSNNYVIKILPLIMILVGNCLAMDCLACIRTIPNGRYHTCLFGCTKVTSDLKFCGRGFLGRRFFVCYCLFLSIYTIHFQIMVCWRFHFQMKWKEQNDRLIIWVVGEAKVSWFGPMIVRPHFICNKGKYHQLFFLIWF